ncbi:MAG: hypothetical protein ACPG5U_09790 [Planktomarina sp.]|uniref:hypothetical protein n=1 Tax=Halocynthiibacter sp. TaxID=1979210 RepID=UPI003C5B9595
MSYDLSIFAPKLNADLVDQWTKRLNAYDRIEYEFHPSVKFEIGWFGFWPIKITTPRPRLFSARQEYMSGFDMSVLNFDFESYFNLKNDEVETRREQLRAEGLDLELWEGFKSQVLISFKPNNRFEARLSFISAAILTEELGGICNDPQTGEMLGQGHVFSWAIERVSQYDLDTQGQNLTSHPFDGWK